ncbi:hypothetical protein DRJ12_01200 [Candidatus Acetothermia bacterium]|nr:MAG: hypothetical protein DRJ12_01200 [Candidatus Acetothermia bacterium]
MFITEKMQRVNVLLPREDAPRFWERIGRAGVMQPGETRRMTSVREHLQFLDLGDLLARLREAAGFLEVDLDSPLSDPTISPLPPDELKTELEVIGRELEEARGKLQQLRESQRSLEREFDHLKVQEAHLRLLEPLAVDIGTLLHLKRFCVLAGTLPEDNLEPLDRSLHRFPHAILPYRTEEHRVQILIICLNQDKSAVEEVLEAALFRPLDLPEEMHGSPHEALEHLQRNEERLQEQRAQVEQALTEFENWRAEKRAELSDFLKVNTAVLSAHSTVGETRAVALATGWVPAREFKQLRAAVQEEPRWVLEAVEIPYEKDKDEDGVTVPSKLRNPGIFKAFEGLVSMYGTPRYGGFDPTVIFSVMFVFLFGMMFGDLGHGFILFLSGLGLLLWPWLRDGWKRTGSVLIAVGASSMVFGTLYGSFFGYENIIPALWFRPLDDINRILIYAIVVGAGVIIMGILINIANLLIQRRYFESLFTRSGFIGLLFYLGLLLAIRAFMGGGLNLGVALLMFIPLIIMLFEEPISKLWHKRKEQNGEEEESPLIRLVVAVVDIFETILVYFSNSLSFIRVAAFALNHVALSLAIFQLGRMLEKMIGGGGVLYILAVIGGNLLILVLEGGIVGIQTLRLEFYEFFSKFFEAEGTAFKPFRLEYRRR